MIVVVATSSRKPNGSSRGVEERMISQHPSVFRGSTLLIELAITITITLTTFQRYGYVCALLLLLFVVKTDVTLQRIYTNNPAARLGKISALLSLESASNGAELVLLGVNINKQAARNSWGLSENCLLINCLSIENYAFPPWVVAGV